MELTEVGLLFILTGLFFYACANEYSVGVVAASVGLVMIVVDRLTSRRIPRETRPDNDDDPRS